MGRRDQDKTVINGPDEPIRAAQYLRMSTDHQQYSTENQADAIARYAEQHGMEIVRTYTDGGKSGLDIGWRPEFQNLITDITKGQADFRVVLVYDISRWGRFQDPDQAAHLEYICRHSGIRIEYCAEQFVNDGSLPSALMKMVLRTQAGEFCRMLSVKVFAGQCRLIQMGYRQGGPAGFGLRRMRIDHTGAQLGILTRGQHKSLQTDRVILVPGPDDEIAVVRRIYRLFVSDGKREGEIADLLNAEGIFSDLGRPWRASTVHQVLINEKYIGNNVFNRRSFKLKSRRVKNPPEQWIRAEGAFTAIVDPSIFQAAQAIIIERSRRFSDQEMLDHLKALHERHGLLSAIVIDEAVDGPSSGAIRHRFGSLLRAYELVGFTPDRDYSYIETNRFLRRLHPQVLADTIAGIEAAGGDIEQDPATDILTINREFTASIVIVRCQETPAGSLRWHIRLDAGLYPDVTIAVRMDRSNREARDYYILPASDMSAPRLRLGEYNGIALDAFRFDTLDPLFDMAGRVKLLEVA